MPWLVARACTIFTFFIAEHEQVTLEDVTPEGARDERREPVGALA